MVTIQLHNTLTRRKDALAPLDPSRVRMYVCGPTVYKRPHIGNARSVVVYDVLFRLLRAIYGEAAVTYARNITDVDDNINAESKARGIPIQELTGEITAQYHEDISALHCLPPSLEPRATEHIPEMVAMIEALLAHGNAYAADGHVLFDVESRMTPSPMKEALFSPSPLRGEGGVEVGPQTLSERVAPPPSQPSRTVPLSPLKGGGALSNWHYGMLSGRKLDDLQAGARIAVESYKRSPGDFVLWKPANPGDDASSIFQSPWGPGRPGWHIECSAMAEKYLGTDFDIHGGGADLMFPHHENEIAQSCCAHPGSGYARLWVHNGFLTVNGEKMSKSLGNFVTVRDLLDRGVKGEAIRLALLSVKYSEPLDWTDKLLTDAQKTLDGAYRAMTTMPQEEAVPEAMLAALGDDLNFPKAIALLHAAPASQLRALGSLLGLLQQSPEAWFKGESGDDTARIEARIEARKAAKAARDFAESDRIREELKAEGILLEDKPGGATEWRKIQFVKSLS